MGLDSITKSIELNGRVFQIGQLPYKKARPVLVKLQQILGPALGELGRSLHNAEKLDLSVGDVAAACEKILSGLSEPDLDQLCSAFETVTKIQADTGAYIPFAVWPGHPFEGRLTDMYRWLYACCEVNFSDFLGVLGGLKERLAVKKDPLGSESPTG